MELSACIKYWISKDSNPISRTNGTLGRSSLSVLHKNLNGQDKVAESGDHQNINTGQGTKCGKRSRFHLGKDSRMNIHSFIHMCIGIKEIISLNSKLKREKKTFRASEQANKWNVNYEYKHSPKQEKWSLEGKKKNLSLETLMPEGSERIHEKSRAIDRKQTPITPYSEIQLKKQHYAK